MSLKIPPPLVALIVMFCMWYLNSLVQWALFHIPYTWVLGILLAVGGFAISLTGIVSFGKKDTTVNPLTPEKASCLVDDGIYGFTRNPMYLGLLSVIIAWAIFLSNWFMLVFPPIIFVLYMNFFQINREEAALEELFGEDYTAYKLKVRRWL